MNAYNFNELIRTGNMEKKPISRAGFDGLIKELKDLKEVQRPEILKTVQWARSLGDLSENADYSAAKEKQRQIDKRIQFIENFIENADVIDIDSLSGDRVVLVRASLPKTKMEIVCSVGFCRISNRMANM